MKFANPVGARDDEIFVAAVEMRAAEVARMQVHALDRGAGGAVEHDDALREQAAEDFDSFSGIGHQRIRTAERGRVDLLEYPMGADVAIWRFG